MYMAQYIHYYPLFVMLMVFSTDHQFQIILDIFLIIHVGLHWFFRNHPENTFDNRLSQGLIIGGAPLGILHMSLILM